MAQSVLLWPCWKWDDFPVFLTFSYCSVKHNSIGFSCSVIKELVLFMSWNSKEMALERTLLRVLTDEMWKHLSQTEPSGLMVRTQAKAHRPHLPRPNDSYLNLLPVPLVLLPSERLHSFILVVGAHWTPPTQSVRLFFCSSASWHHCDNRMTREEERQRWRQHKKQQLINWRRHFSKDNQQLCLFLRSLLLRLVESSAKRERSAFTVFSPHLTFLQFKGLLCGFN